MRYGLLVCLLFSLMGCAEKPAPPQTVPEGVYTVVVLNAADGFPLRGVVIIVGDRLFVGDGKLRIDGVPAPVTISAWKPGFSASYPKVYPFGIVKVTLYQQGFTDN